MSRRFALILACGTSLFSFGVQASPIVSHRCKKRHPISYWCGTGVGWASTVVYGYCIRNGTVAMAPVVVAPSPVVIAPAPVVAPTVVCPSGYYLGPYGRCLLLLNTSVGA